MRRWSGLWIAALLVASSMAPVTRAAEPITLRVYLGWGSLPDIGAMAVELFEAAHPEIRIDAYGVSGGAGAATENLLVQMIAGAGPDLFVVRAQGFGRFATEGMLHDLTPYYERDVNFDDYLPMFSTVMVGGRYYGVPYEGGGYRTEGMFVNRDLFEAAGHPIPSSKVDQALTFNEWRETARRLTIDVNGDGNPEQYGTHYRTSRWEMFLPSNGVTVFTEGHTDTLIDTPEAIEVLTLLQDLRVTDRSVPLSGFPFHGGKLATATFWRTRVASIQPQVNGAFDWSTMAMPAGRAGSVGVIRMNPIVMNDTIEHPEAGWTFLRFYLSEPVQRGIAATGRAVALRSVALDPEYISFDEPPYDLSPFLYGDAVSDLLNQPPGALREPEAVVAALNAMWSGEMSAAAAAEEMGRAWRAALSGQ